MVLRSRSVICARPLKLYIVKSSGRTQTRQPRATLSRCCCCIKYHNAPGTSIGIRCNQFGRGPKAVVCKSSLQGGGNTNENQTPLRGQWSDPYTSIPYKFDFQRTARTWKTLSEIAIIYCKWYKHRSFLSDMRVIDLRLNDKNI